MALPLAAFLWGLGSDLGDDVRPGFYSAVAQVIPVLLLALLLEMQELYGRIRKLGADLEHRLKEPGDETPTDGDTDSREETEMMLCGVRSLAVTVQLMVLGFAVAAALGEIAALYALAANESTTFLLMLCVLSLWTMLFMLIGVFVRRFAV